MKIASIAEIKSQFSAFVKASADGPVFVTRNGRPVAALVGVGDDDQLERLLISHSPKMRAIFGASCRQIESGKGIPHDVFWGKRRSRRRAAKRS